MLYCTTREAVGGWGFGSCPRGSSRLREMCFAVEMCQVFEALAQGMLFPGFHPAVLRACHGKSRRETRQTHEVSSGGSQTNSMRNPTVHPAPRPTEPLLIVQEHCFPTCLPSREEHHTGNKTSQDKSSEKAADAGASRISGGFRDCRGRFSE